MNYKTTPTSALIVACKKKDQKAQMELYQRFHTPLYQAAFGILKKPEDALDAMQEGLIIAFDKLSQFEGKGSFEGWLRKIVIRKSIALYHQKKRFISLDASKEEIPQPEEEEQISVSPQNINAQQLGLALDRLKDHYALILKLYYLEGYSHQEISSIMNWSSSKSRTLLSRAKTALKKQLNDR